MSHGDTITHLEEDVPIPIIHQPPTRYLILDGTSTRDISTMIAEVAQDFGARMSTDREKSGITLTVFAPATTPVGGLCDCVCYLTVYLRKDGQRQVEFTHLDGSRTLAATLYRHLSARCIDHVTYPPMDRLLVDGKPRPCKVYTARPLLHHGATTELPTSSVVASPGVAARSLTAIVQNTVHECKDVQVPALQLLARFTCGNEWFSNSVQGGLCHTHLHKPLVRLLQQMREVDPTALRCILCILSNLAGNPLHRDSVRQLMDEAKVREYVLSTIDAVEEQTFQSPTFRDALRSVANVLG